MSNHGPHESHPAIIKRLKRAGGHLNSVIAMIEQGRDCIDIAQQLHAVEKAITQAKRVLIQDHIDHCLDSVVGGTGPAAPAELADFKTITRYL